MKLPFNVPFREAADFFAKKVPLTRDEFDQLSNAVKTRAFTVATITKAEILNDTMTAVQQAIDEGLTLADFRDLLDATMDVNGWSGLTPWHMETVFRTNIQSAYGSGRYAQQVAVQDDFPFLRYFATHDSRVRPSHLALDGTVAPIGDPFWKKFYPPWAYQCRCWTESLSDDEAQAIGIKPVNYLEDTTSDFSSPAAGDDFNPDLSNLDPVLRLKVEKALASYRTSDDSTE